jgi:hypothetical protein
MIRKALAALELTFVGAAGLALGTILGVAARVLIT